jgi:hypothetical protein
LRSKIYCRAQGKASNANQGTLGIPGGQAVLAAYLAGMTALVDRGETPRSKGLLALESIN